MLFNYVIKCNKSNVAKTIRLITDNMDTIIDEYKNQNTIIFNESLDIQQIIARTQSIVLKVGKETRLNCLSTALEHVFYGQATNDVKVPRWS